MPLPREPVVANLTYAGVTWVTRDRLRFRIQMHENADLAAAAKFWADVAGVPVDELQRPTLKRHVPLSNRKNMGDGYLGCLTISVLRSAELYRRIEGTWWAVRRARPSRDLVSAEHSRQGF